MFFRCLKTQLNLTRTKIVNKLKGIEVVQFSHAWDMETQHCQQASPTTRLDVFENALSVLISFQKVEKIYRVFV